MLSIEIASDNTTYSITLSLRKVNLLLDSEMLKLQDC